MGDVLVDAGTRHSGRRIFRQIDGHTVTSTRAHPRPSRSPGCEQGGLRAARNRLWCGEPTSSAMESGQPRSEGLSASTGSSWSAWGGPATRSRAGCTRATRWRASRCSTCRGTRPVTWPTGASRTGSLIAGDVLNNMNVMTGIPGLHEPRVEFTHDPALNRESARRVASLGPRSSASATGRRCATRASWSSSRPGCRAERSRPMPAVGLHRAGDHGVAHGGEPAPRGIRAVGLEPHRARRRASGPTQHGAEVADSPADVAERSEIVITMVVDGPQVEAVLLGDDGRRRRARATELAVRRHVHDRALLRRGSIGERLAERECASWTRR